MAHVRALWGPYWAVPGGAFLLYVGAVTAVGDFRPEHGLFLAAVLSLGYASPRTKRFFLEMLPFIVVGVGYDLIRYARRIALSSDRVLTCSLQDLDRALFPAGSVSAQEWLAARPVPLVDLVLSVPYAVFVYVAFAYAAYLYVVDRPRMQRYLWAFAIANYVSFTCWLVFPAAPPWYVHQHGCVADLAAAPQAAGLLRVDALLDTDYFASFYSRTASVFGAMPSMHNAYPALGLLTAWRHVGWNTRPLHVAYLIAMFTASLYFDHHWVIDAIAGWLTAALGVALAPLVVERVLGRAEPTAVPVTEGLGAR